jgi:hypothetical protein
VKAAQIGFFQFATGESAEKKKTGEAFQELASSPANAPLSRL